MAELGAEMQQFVQHLTVERRLAARTVAMYTEALLRLQASALTAGVALRAAQTHHIRSWVAQLRGRGLAPRSIAIALAAWRGLYRWWGRQGLVQANPVEGIRPPKAPKPLPKALSVQQAVAQVTAVIDEFPQLYAAALLQGQRAKLGLLQAADDAGDAALAGDWLALLHEHGVDFTLAWRRLADAAAGDANPLRALFAEAATVNPWLARWQARCAQDDADLGNAGLARATRMRLVNPWIIPRNHRVEEALAAASEHDDLVPFRDLLAALQRPYDEDTSLARYAEPAPAQVTAQYQTFCGT